MPRKIALLRDIDNYEHIRAVFLYHEHCSLKKCDAMQLEGLPRLRVIAKGIISGGAGGVTTW